MKRSSAAAVQMRLDTHKTRKSMTKRDWLIALLISAVYAIVAFTNLGSFGIPQTSTNVNESVDIELPEGETVSTLKYYADYGEAEFQILVSGDGVNYTPVTYEEEEETKDVINHEKKNLYKWHPYDVNTAVRYIMVQPASENADLPILEMAVYDDKNQLIQPVSALTENGAQALWFDEQEMVPAERTYMTDFYFDELYHVRTAYENIHEIQPYETTHPPLGKVIITVGIHMFGMNAFGWRFMGTLTGVLMLPVMYVFAKLLLKKTKYAAFATILFAVDFMHFAQTRIGTIDSYSILWIMLMYLFMYQYMQANFNRQPLSKTFIPLFWCGFFFGVGAATKWLCIYAGIGLLALFLISMFQRYQEYRLAKEKLAGDDGETEGTELSPARRSMYAGIVDGYVKNVLCTLLFCILVFIVIPVAIYLLSYIPYFMVTEGRAYESLKDIWNNQTSMLTYHGETVAANNHPFASRWYSWIADERPVLFFSYQSAENGTIATLSTMGNPLIWWTGLIASIWLIVGAIKGKRRNMQLAFLAIAALSQLLPWVFIRRELYIYHYFATVPFLILLLVFWLKYLERDFKYGRQFGIVFVVACVIMFVLFYPVITGVPADADYVNALRWLPRWPFY